MMDGGKGREWKNGVGEENVKGTDPGGPSEGPDKASQKGRSE